LADLSRRQVLFLSGTIYLIATLTLVVSRTPLGSALFFLCLLLAAGAYGAMLTSTCQSADAPRRLLLTAFLFAVAFRVPLAIAPVGADNDMVRYLWDGRVQRLGYNPYLVVPADPAVAHTHTDQTRWMPSRHASTPYPPGAQLFFRLIVSIRQSTRAMKTALVVCDILTILILWRWLLIAGRSPWLALI
jgi:alpha-1,6-mannosyltransferase